MTIKEILKLTEEFFQKKELQNSRLDAEILLAEVLGCNRLKLYLDQDKPLEEKEIDLYREYVKKRANHVPIQYILGYTYFYGYKFKVTNDVLIPRPDTEILVEQTINIVNKKRISRILEIGFGSGCIILSLSKNLPNVEFIGIDISEGAFNIANENLKELNIKNVKLVLESIENYKDNDKFDLIVSNPPYISKDEYEKLSKEVLNYEPKIALTDNSDGLKFYRLISQRAKDLLNKNGVLIFEVGYNQAFDVENILVENEFKNIFKVKDYNNYFRVVGGELN